MEMLELPPLTDPATYISLATLAAMEIVLGIDNIVFITILCGRLPEDKQPMARRLGLGFALITRLGLLFALAWIMSLTAPLFELPFDLAHEGAKISGKDLILLGGGLFLLGKASHEIYHNVEHPEDEDEHGEGAGGGKVKEMTTSAMGWILIQIIFLDIVFSLDSVITAVGMVQHVSIMAAAMIIAVIAMVIFAGPVGDFVQKHASVRILALAFLVLIGVLLMVEGFGQHVSKGYIYFAMGFSLIIELINMRRRRREKRLWTVEEEEVKAGQAKKKLEESAM